MRIHNRRGRLKLDTSCYLDVWNDSQNGPFLKLGRHFEIAKCHGH